MNRVFVTGLGFTTSIGNTYDEVLDSLRNLKTGIAPYEPFQNERIPVNVTGTIKGYDLESDDPEDWTVPEDVRPGRALLRSLSPHGLYSFAAIEQALVSASLTTEQISGNGTGFYSASAGSTSMLHYHLNRMHKYGVDRLSPKAIVSSIPGTLNFSFVSHYKIKGHSCGFVSACASSGHAIGMATEAIRSGLQERMIVLGAEDGNLDTILPFAGMRALSLEKEPSMASKPFDEARSGFVGTGGATVLILESESCARDRNADAFAEILGWGQTSDGFSSVLPEPDGEGLARSMELALKNAQTEPEDVDYINAHATATVPGDIAELRAIRSIFGESSEVLISSTKALTGHGLSLASAMEMAFSIVALREGFCPGTAHLENPDPEVGNLKVIAETSDLAPKVVLSNSSGFGGANVSIVVGLPS